VCSVDIAMEQMLKGGGKSQRCFDALYSIVGGGPDCAVTISWKYTLPWKAVYMQGVACSRHEDQKLVFHKIIFSV
jgi:hypothetical protein